jgi:hypothetical protein
MALVIGGNATVATGMSPIVEAGLYADAIFIDGVTFTSQYNIGSAGQIQVEKYAGGRGVKPGQAGGDFTDRDYTNTVVDINVNNSFKDSVKVPAYFEATMPTSVLMNKTLEVTQKTGTGRQESALAALVDQGTASADTDELTVDNIKSKVITARSGLRKKHAKPNVVIASVDTYALMLEAAGKDFTPMYNDDVIRNGKVGLWLGMLWVEADLLDGSTSDYQYLNDSGVAIPVDTSDVDFIMYDFMAFSLIDRLDGLRVKESEQFFGSKVQEEVVSGFKVTNADCVSVKKSLQV